MRRFPLQLVRSACAVALLLAFAPLVAEGDEPSSDASAAAEVSLVRLAANHIDGVLGSVADSTRALGAAYQRELAVRSERAASDGEQWLALRTTRGETVGLRTWPATLTSPPAFQAPYPAFYSYRGATLGEAVLHELEVFERLVPTFRSAYESFPFSWVYVTTVHDAMMIYPYLPIEQAVDNATPTQSPFYEAADFENRAVGWTSPYLDLVGAGMMVTASFPVYEGDRLLSVVSRDITLKQLASSVLSPLAEDGHSVLIVSEDGLAIDATDPGLAAEIDRVDAGAAAAVLHYRTAQGMESVAAQGAVASESSDIAALVERVLVRIGDGGPVRFDADGRRVLAARVATTGWILISIRPLTPSPHLPGS